MFGKQITFIFLFRFLFQNECTHDCINFIVHLFLVHYFSHTIAGNYYGRSCGHNFKPQIFIMVQYCTQIKTSFKFRFF